MSQHIHKLSRPKTKIAIVGTGMVGSSFAYAAMIRGIAAEIILIDSDEGREEGEVMDLSHALTGTTTGSVRGGGYTDCADVDVIVLCAGAAQKPGETRLDLLRKNSQITRDILSKMGPLNQDTVMIIATNPVDVLTHLVKQMAPVPPDQIFGSGTSLDTARLKANLGHKLGVNDSSVHGYVLGEHGDSGFIPWSTVNVAGVSADSLLKTEEMCELERQTMRSAYEIIKRKHATYFGIGVLLVQLAESVLHDRKTIIPVSTEPGEAYGITGISLGVPAIIGRGGVERIWPLTLRSDEVSKLHHSAEILTGFWKGLHS